MGGARGNGGAAVPSSVCISQPSRCLQYARFASKHISTGIISTLGILRDDGKKYQPMRKLNKRC